MYSRDFGNYGMIPPGYSGVAIRRNEKREEDECPYSNHPRRPVFEDRIKAGSGSPPPTVDNHSTMNDDILLAGLIILLMSEGKCDSITLFALCFLLFS